METTELFYPQIIVQLGKYTLTSGIEIGVYSSEDSYFDWARVRFTVQFRDKITLAAGDDAIIKLGYNGVFDDVFKGYLTKPYNESALNEVLLKDDMRQLEKTIITETFLNATPQEILRYCLSAAGITNIKLSTTNYPAKPRFPVSRKNVIAVINSMQSAWGISLPFFFQSGTFHWGVKPTQEKIYSFEYASNIISLTKQGALWELETVSAPFIKHSHQIKVTHPQVSGEFEVKKVVFQTNEAGFIRTYIYF